MIKYPRKSSWYVSDGWHPLLEELIEKLNILCENMNVQVTQIKEKFGGLRFYADGLTEEGWKLVEEYERKAYHVCEKCGEDGKYRDALSWKQTLCDTHYKEELKEIRKHWGFRQWKNHLVRSVANVVRSWQFRFRNLISCNKKQ